MTDVRINIDKQKIDAAMNLALIEGLNATQLMLSEYVRLQLSKPGTGRLYRVNKGKARGRNLRERRQRIGRQVGGFHQASAPGFPPAANTNRLRASWMVSGINKRNQFGGYTILYKVPQAFVLEYGSTLKYAPFLEFGNKKFRVRFKPRPYLRPILPIANARVAAIFEKALKRNFGG